MTLARWAAEEAKRIERLIFVFRVVDDKFAFELLWRKADVAQSLASYNKALPNYSVVYCVVVTYLLLLALSSR